MSYGIDVSIARGSAPVAARVSHAGPATLNGIYVANYAGGTRYIQFFNQTTTPTTSAVPILQYVINIGAPNAPSTLTFDVGWFNSAGPMTQLFSDGLAWAVSSAAGVLSLADPTDCDVEVHYSL